MTALENHHAECFFEHAECSSERAECFFDDRPAQYTHPTAKWFFTFASPKDNLLILVLMLAHGVAPND